MRGADRSEKLQNLDFVRTSPKVAYDALQVMLQAAINIFSAIVDSGRATP